MVVVLSRGAVCAGHLRAGLVSRVASLSARDGVERTDGTQFVDAGEELLIHMGSRLLGDRGRVTAVAVFSHVHLPKHTHSKQVPS